jgi:peptidylprolyl isomerase
VDPPKTIQVVELTKGDGEEVKQGDVVSVTVVSWKWGSTEPLSYSTSTTKQPMVFPVKAGDITAPLAKAVNDQKLGTRVMAVLPPAEGSLGSALGAEAGDTVVVVMDILEKWAKDAEADPKAKPTGVKTGPVVTGDLGGPATVTVPGGIAAPDKVETQVIAEGSGPKVADGDTIVYNYAAVDWTGGDGGSSWKDGNGPASITVQSNPYGDGSEVTAFSGLAGIPVGSRVLVTLPGKENSYLAEAVVIDIIAVAKPVPGADKTEPTPSPEASAEATEAPEPGEQATEQASESP